MAKRKSKSQAPADDVDDPKLGLLRFISHLNPELDEFEGSVSIEGQDVQLVLYTDESLNLDATIKRTRELIRRHGANMKRAAMYLGHNLLPHYNNGWRNEGDPKLTRKAMVDHMKLTEIVVHADGTASYWFDVGDLFRGHALLLFMDSKTEFVDYDTPG